MITDTVNVREYRRGNKTKGQSRETGNIGYIGQRKTNQKHNTIQYVLDNTMRKQTQIT